MAELDRFDSQLTAAVRGLADRARTEVDAVDVATRAARGRRAATGWFGRTVPVPVALLLLIGLILLLATSLAVSGWRLFDSSLVPAGPTASPAITAASPAPTIDPLGRVHITGTESVVLTTQPTTLPDIDATHIFGGVVTITTTANDPRVSGTGTFAFSVDANGDVGREWGTYRLQVAGGSWDGPCSGATWDAGNAAIGSCWLVGSGSFAGLTYHRSYSWIPGRVWVAGIVYPGPPPQP